MGPIKEEHPVSWNDVGDMLRSVRAHARLSGDAIISADCYKAWCIGFRALRSGSGSETRRWEIRVSKVQTIRAIESADPELWFWMGGDDWIRTAEGRVAFADKCSGRTGALG